jgi:hypothetical protein
MAFAASPTGSIGARLPPDDSPLSHCSSEVARQNGDKDWRYSLAPKLLAASHMDVREPVPGGSPTLPDTLPLNAQAATEPALEPLSSGFNSPTGPRDGPFPNDSPPHQHDLKLQTIQADDDDSEDLVPPENAGTLLVDSMTELRISSQNGAVDMQLEESPTLAHLKRISTNPSNIVPVSDSDDEEIFLSEPAEAAANSAKAKRSLLRRLFPRKDHRESSNPEHNIPSPVLGDSECTPCPDPTLHKLMTMAVCPDPGAHLIMATHGLSAGHMTPEAALPFSRQTPSPFGGGLLPPAPPFHRASSTGSPMPFARPHTATVNSSPGPFHDVQQHFHHGLSAPPAARLYPTARPHTRTGYPGMETEHFQPGWYYAQEPMQPAQRLNPMTYSFSTAAAKIVGQSAAPDDRIRDSYRTDTLTPLAKPASRFRKTGIGALASARGAGKHYDGLDRMNSRATRPDTSRSYTADQPQFRTSFPWGNEHMIPHHQKRRRPRELDDSQFDVPEDETADVTASRPGTRAQDDQPPIEMDENTRAAVRMSLYGAETPETVSTAGTAREGMREISPNVTAWRKGMRVQPRKKRRPSYWDGDLKQIRESPAGRGHVRSIQPGAERHVMTSPAKEDVESVRVSVRGEEQEGGGRLKEVESDTSGGSEVAPGVEVMDEMEVEV